eukprot:CAMPEP_0170739756 /NCGR_PEP_ID=MMETSP0437-20130122/5328_1 /TAXON_ID=0 /ORGANISM="Sexangularia sp." /LENGTH=512 /DNA_ID=CAMNT_0011078227 /DNA_START=70 /DNA_END=1608 /DNA_ORIENTATION=+
MTTLRLIISVGNGGAAQEFSVSSSEPVSNVISTVLAANPQLPKGVRYCLSNPDPKVVPSQRFLEGSVPLTVAASLRSGDRLELQLAPIKLSVRVATSNSNVVASLSNGSTLKISPNVEICFSIGSIRQLIAPAARGGTDYCMAKIDVDSPEGTFVANWLNACSTPSEAGLQDGDTLLLWPVKLFLEKTLGKLKSPTIAGYTKVSHKTDGSSTDKRFILCKFNLLFIFKSDKKESASAEEIVNLEHYFVSDVEQCGKRKWRFKLEKVMESFVPTPKIYWFLYDTQNGEYEANQARSAVALECANRMKPSKYPPPRISVPDRLPKSLFPKDKTIPPPRTAPNVNVPLVHVESGVAVRLSSSSRNLGASAAGRTSAAQPPGPPPGPPPPDAAVGTPPGPPPGPPPPEAGYASTSQSLAAGSPSPSAAPAAPPPPPTSAPPSQYESMISVEEATALYDYTATAAKNDKGELAISFSGGDRLLIFERRADGWCKGRNTSSGEEGLVPATYISPPPSS